MAAERFDLQGARSSDLKVSGRLFASYVLWALGISCILIVGVPTALSANHGAQPVGTILFGIGAGAAAVFGGLVFGPGPRTVSITNAAIDFEFNRGRRRHIDLRSTRLKLVLQVGDRRGQAGVIDGGLTYWLIGLTPRWNTLTQEAYEAVVAKAKELGLRTETSATRTDSGFVVTSLELTPRASVG